MSEVALREKTQQVLARIRSEDVRAEIAAALPEGVSVDRFIRGAVTAFMEDQAKQRDPSKWIINADPASLLTALVKCAQDGLLPDGREAALVKRGDMVSYMPMVGGLRRLAAEYGWTLRSHAVYASDEFEHTTEPSNIHHREVFAADRGPIVAAYATARHTDGRRENLVMSAQDLAKRRAAATTDAVWAKWEAEMSAKTAERALARKLPLAEGDRLRMLRVVEALELEPGQATQDVFGRQYNPETGELTEASPALLQPAMEAASAPAPPGADGSAGGDEGDPDGVPPTPAVREVSEADELAALEASMFKAPGGKYGAETLGEALTLGEIHALPREEGAQSGPDYLRLMLQKGKDGDYRDAIEAFCKVAMPDDYAEIMAKRAEA
jgi:recombination protein RecT